MNREAVILLLFLLISSSALPQIGGRNSYEFIDVAVNAHGAGVGGVNVSIRDHDINMVLQNPALFNKEMYKMVSLSYLPFYAGIHASSLVYGDDFGKYGKYAMGLQYFNYGTIKHTDDTGAELGTFTPHEFMIFGATKHTIDNYTLGASVKLAGSAIETYSSYAAMVDIGGVFRHPAKDFTVGLVVKNAGFAFKKYTPETKMSMPFDVQVGTSYKFDHMPLRLSVTAHHLHKFDIVYLDSTQKAPTDLEGNTIEVKKTFGDKLVRHFVIGGELILSKNFHVRAGYNFLRRKELRLQTKSGGAGFSFGFMMRIKSFELAYTKAYYHVAGGTNHITIAMNMGALLKKK